MKIKETMYVHKAKYRTEPVIQLTDMSEYGYVLLGTVDIEFEFEMPSEAEQVKKEIEMLTAEKNRILAEAHMKTQNIQDQINSLLCLENNSAQDEKEK